MAALGIPNTRSLAAVVTGDTVLRERPLPGAVLTRVASSHIASVRSSFSPPAATSMGYAFWPIT
jgi:hypothetical protein